MLKGKTEPIEVFEPLDDAITDTDEYLIAHRLLVAEDPQAEAAFESLAKGRPGDALVAMHLVRLRNGQRGATIDLRLV